MFFTKLALVIAWLLVILGGLQVALAFSIDPTMAPRYFGSRTLGQAIDRGVLCFLIGIAGGVVAEISKSVAAKAEVKKQEVE
ncbi:hypothetical protein LGH82_23565 [Mesorhizobium sp. PAMC28654]|uniref:hypothetical protein n=1 Tax=Mesorhizobium sp. PAMC28654 TaxID=2880934 RepID=UPI001D0B1F37|nr:hypothetical protein [Mesorhizobium sp. PAMC28654]UDL88115.1 hypothetical protein LGH82_23565 [Mesorhizobium sp. PAMC28654]